MREGERERQRERQRKRERERKKEREREKGCDRESEAAAKVPHSTKKKIRVVILKRCPNDQKESTNKNAFTYFENRILKHF